MNGTGSKWGCVKVAERVKKKKKRRIIQSFKCVSSLLQESMSSRTWYALSER